MEEEHDSESTIVGAELLDANIPALSSENTKRQFRWVEGLWNKWIEKLMMFIDYDVKLKL